MRRAALCLAFLVAACGYQAGLDLRDEGVRRVAVRVVGNETFRQRLEIPLTRELQEALVVHSNVVPASVAEADAVLEVDIADVRNRTLVQGAQVPIREGALEFALDARLVATDGGRVLRDRRILERAEFRVPVGENLDSATREAVRDLARKIVLSLEADF